MVRYITFICEALNCLYPRLRNHNNGEEDAWQADASNANKDGSETELVAEQKKQLGDGKAKKPKCAVVKTPNCLLKKSQSGSLKRISHLLPWLKEFTKESVAHRTKTKLEGSNKQDESDHNEDVVGEEVIDVGIAKD